MKWTTLLYALWIAAINFTLAWIVVCLLHIWEVSSSHIDNDIILITGVVSVVLDMVIIAVILEVHSVVYRQGMRSAILGMFFYISFVVAMISLWMPFAGYSWEFCLIVPSVGFVVALLLCSRAYYIRCTWGPWFSKCACKKTSCTCNMAKPIAFHSASY